MTVYQKSEQCWCGAIINVEHCDEDYVISECARFRADHRHDGTHIRGITKTACGLDLWRPGPYGPVTTVDTVGFPFLLNHPVTCPACIEAWNSILLNNNKIGDNNMVAYDIGSVKMSAFAGEPDRTDLQFCIEAVGHGLLYRPGFGFKVCEQDEPPEVFDSIDEAQKARREAEYAYTMLGVPADIKVRVRKVKTFIGPWSDHIIGETHDS